MKILFIIAIVFVNILFSYEINKPFDGYLTHYNYGGFGACGNLIDAGSQKFVAVSPEWFTPPSNLDYDPICKKCLKIEYQGKIVKVPVRDKCFTCDQNHMELSLPAFKDLERPEKEYIKNAIFTFIDC